MKNVSKPLIWLGIFVWFVFMGVTAVSYGVGALYPPLNKVAQPFVCSNGQMTVEGYTSYPLPGTTITQIYWYCVDHQSGVKTDITGGPLHLYAGAIWGVLLFAAGAGLYYLYTLQIVWVQNVIKVVLALGLLLFVLFPLWPAYNFGAPAGTATPDPTTTAVQATYEALTSQETIAFVGTDKPLANWRGIPIMPEAIASQPADDNSYMFNVQIDSGTIETYYTDQLQALGWTLADSRFQGLQFTKGQDVLLVIVVPRSDLQSFVVTLVRVP